MLPTLRTRDARGLVLSAPRHELLVACQDRVDQLIEHVPRAIREEVRVGVPRFSRSSMVRRLTSCLPRVRELINGMALSFQQTMGDGCDQLEAQRATSWRPSQGRAQHRNDDACGGTCIRTTRRSSRGVSDPPALGARDQNRGQPRGVAHAPAASITLPLIGSEHPHGTKHRASPLLSNHQQSNNMQSGFIVDQLSMPFVAPSEHVAPRGADSSRCCRPPHPLQLAKRYLAELRARQPETY